MTREEAIAILNHNISACLHGTEWGEALDMAIKALEQDPCEDCISRSELLKAIDTLDKFGFEHTGCFVREPKDDYVTYVHYDDVIKCIKGMPSVQPKTEQMDRLYSYLNDMRFGIVPDETTQQDERSERFAQVDIIDSIMEWIDKLPSVSTEKTGRWITCDVLQEVKCSECRMCFRYTTNYCPNCGAKMEVEHE